MKLHNIKAITKQKMKLNKSDIVIKALRLMISIVIMLSVASPSKAEECGYAAGGRLCPEEYCCSIWGYCGLSHKHCSEDYCQAQCAPWLRADDDVIISRELFDQMLPNRTASAAFYTHHAFLAAARHFPGFGATGNLQLRKRELAAFFAQTSHQTKGYSIVSEVNGGDYSAPSLQWPSYPGRQYYGRGPFQLTYNYNYGPAGRAIGENLLVRPELVAEDPTVSFKTAIWFWMTPRDNMPSPHDVITGAWAPKPADVAANWLPGYGVVTNIINGRVECGHADDDSVQNRIGLYKRFCEILGVSPGDNLDCKDQRPFEFSLTNGYLKYPDQGVLQMA